MRLIRWRELGKRKNVAKNNKHTLYMHQVVALKLKYHAARSCLKNTAISTYLLVFFQYLKTKKKQLRH
jgi:hypothetical protein